jgi:cholesterol transport system auxiliary component
MWLVLSGGLTGCTVASLVGANSEPPPVTHDLLASARRGLGRISIQLTVNEPSAVEALSSSRIAIKPGPHEISYFAAAVWTDKLPRLLQLRLIETFENSRILKAVSTGSDRIRGDFGLALSIRDFQVEVNGGSAQAHVRLNVKMVDEDRGQLVASREFSATVRAHNDGVEAGVDALKEAFSSVSTQIMRWIVSRRIIIADASE